MITEFERIYRLLDLRDDADSAAARDTYARRLAALERQKAIAGSRAELRMAERALAEIAPLGAEIERLAASLEVQTFLQAARTAIAEKKAARARRELGYATCAAEKSGLDALIRAVEEVEDELADSGLARDVGLDGEISDIEACLTACQTAIEAGLATEPPAAPAAALTGQVQEVQKRLDAVAQKAAAAPGTAQKAAVEALRTRLATLSSRLASWISAHEAHAAKMQAWRDACDELDRDLEESKLVALSPADLHACEADIADRIAEVARTPELLDKQNLLQDLQHRLLREGVRREVASALADLEKRAAATGFGDDFEASLDHAAHRAMEEGFEQFAGPISTLRCRLETWRNPPPSPPPVPVPTPVAVPPPPPAGVAEPPATVPKVPLEPAAPARAPVFAFNAPTNPTIVLAPIPEPAAADRFTLVGPDGERCHVLCLERVLFGRSKNCDVPVRAHHPTNADEEQRVTSSISRVHFALEREPDDVVLADGGPTPDGGWKSSANGTFDLEGRAIDRNRLFRTGLTSFAIVRDAPPVAPPQWDITLQMRAPLPPRLATLRDALPLSPDAIHLRRTDGLCEDVLIVWRAASLRELGLTDTPVCIVRHKDGFLLAQDERIVGIEMGFRVGTTWSVASYGKLAT